MASSSTKDRLPKDAQVIISMLKEAGIYEYEPRVVNQLLEFTYRYVTGILEESRVYAQHAKKKTIDIDDVKLASIMQLEQACTNPPHRDLLMEVSRNKNTCPLPIIKPHHGLRLPPDRYSVMACNYKLKSNKKPPLVNTKTMGSTILTTNRGVRNVGNVGNLKTSMTMLSTLQPATPLRVKPSVMTQLTPQPGSKPTVIKINPPGVVTSTLSTTSTMQQLSDVEKANILKRKLPDDSF